MDVEMPDGTTIEGVPEGTTRAQLQAKYTARTATASTGPQVSVPSDWQQPAPPHNDPVMDRFIDRTAPGRILDAFGQGFKNEFGSQPTLSPETEAAMRAAKVDHTIIGAARRSFNEVLFRPAAAALDGAWRAAAALPGATGRAVGQAVNEMDPGHVISGGNDEKVRDEFEGFGALTPMALGVANELGVVAKTPEANAVRSGAHELGGVEAPKAPAIEPTPAPKVMATSEGLEQEPHSKFADPQSSVLDKAGNINLDRIQAPGDVKDVIRQAAEESGGFMDARRGTMSLAETEQLADASGIPTEQLLKRKVGEAFNAEEAVQLRKAMVQSATSVRDLAAKAVGGTEQDVLAFHEATVRHTAIQEQVAGMTAEAGRALSSFRIMAGEEGGVADVLKNMGGRESIEDVARKINELDTPAKVSKFLMDARKATTGDMFIEAWVNGLLSGPTTHIVNALSNMTTALWNIPETAVAAGIGRLRGAAAERVMFGEAGQELFGIVQGSKEGLIAAAKAYKEEAFQGGAKIDLPRKNAIPSKILREGAEKKTISWTNPFTNAQHDTGIPLTGQVELGGKQVRVWGRLLTASDEYFKAIGARQALNRLAYRQASKEGLRGEDHAARLAQLVDSPTDAMRAEAREAAEYQTFTNPLGATGEALQKLQQSSKATRMILTFIRTPINIAKYTVRDRTPLGLFSKEIRDNLASADPIVRDTTKARLALGTAVSVTAVSLAAQGLITGGGPSDPKHRAALYAAGWQPYSVRIGDMYYSYGRIEPLATLLGLPADMYDKAGDIKADDPLASKVEAGAGLVVASLAKNLASKTSLTGLTDLVQAVEDPDRYGKQYVAKLAASLIPSLSAQTARMTDPYMRDTKEFFDLLDSRVPGLSEHAPARLDIWGQPIPNQTGIGALTGVYQSRIEHDPVNQELLALEVYPAKPQDKIRGVKLTAPQYEEYQMTAGRMAKMQLDGLVNSDGWASMPAFARKEIIENTVRNSRQSAAGLMQMRHPDLISQGVQNRVNQIRGVAK